MKTNEVTVGDMLTTREGDLFLVVDKKENEKLSDTTHWSRQTRIGDKARNNNRNWKWNQIKLKPISSENWKHDRLLYWTPATDAALTVNGYITGELYTIDHLNSMKEKLKNKKEVEALILELMATEDWSSSEYDPFCSLARCLRRDIIDTAKREEKFAGIVPKSMRLKSDEKSCYSPNHNTGSGRCSYKVHCLDLEKKTFRMCFYFHDMKSESWSDELWENRIEFICSY